LTDLDEIVDKLLEKYKSAVYARDVAAFMRLYDPKVRVFDAWGIWSYEGAAPWRIAVEGWFAAHAGERLKVSFEDVRCSGNSEVAIVSAVVTYCGVSAQGELLRSMQNRISWGLRTSGHVLRIVHEHTSVPVGYEDQKAILLRPSASQATAAG
jgi:ketosteroid isomerase-like protein